MNKKYQEYKEKGLCRRCGKKPIEGKTRCGECHKSHLKYQRRYKEKAIKMGLCRYCCKEPFVINKSMCKKCLKAHSKRGVETYKKYRKKAIENYGSKCNCCGLKNSKYLQLDHINNDGAEHRRKLSPKSKSGRGSGNLYKWACINDFPDNLQLLCANCHQAKTFYGGCTPEDHELMIFKQNI